MKEFKFLSNNDKPIFFTDMSFEAIQFLENYSENRNLFEMRTSIGIYKILNYICGDGEIVGGTVEAYPIEEPNIRYTFNIRNNGILSYNVEVSYWNTAAQIINLLQTN